MKQIIQTITELVQIKCSKIFDFKLQQKFV